MDDGRWTLHALTVSHRIIIIIIIIIITFSALVRPIAFNCRVSDRASEALFLTFMNLHLGSCTIHYSTMSPSAVRRPLICLAALAIVYASLPHPVLLFFVFVFVW